jgi:hypothetical protein
VFCYRPTSTRRIRQSCCPSSERAGGASHDQEHARDGYQFVPPGWTMYAPASPDDLFMRPDQGDGLIDAIYGGDGVLDEVLFVRISDRMCGFLGYFLRDDFDRGQVTLNRLLERFRATSDDSP